LSLSAVGNLPENRVTIRGVSAASVQWYFYFFASQTVEVGVGVVLGVEISALSVHPTLTLLALYPLFAVISALEVDLFAVETIELLLVLHQTLLTQILDIVLMSQVVLRCLVLATNLIAAHVQIGLGVLGQTQRTLTLWRLLFSLAVVGMQGTTHRPKSRYYKLRYNAKRSAL